MVYMVCKLCFGSFACGTYLHSCSQFPPPPLLVCMSIFVCMCTCSFTVAFSLRQRMLSFVQNIQYYMTVEVLEPHWSVMEGRLREVSTIDEVLREHNDFLDRCLKDCMLTNSEILKVVSRLFTLCDAFATILLLHEGDGGRPGECLWNKNMEA